MNADLSPASPILTSAFRSALWQQFAIVALIFALLLIAWGGSPRAWPPGPGASPARVGCCASASG
jgi:hypothetical protein